MDAKLKGSRLRIQNAYASLYQAWLVFGEAWDELEKSITSAHDITTHDRHLIISKAKVDIAHEDRIELIGRQVLQLSCAREAIHCMVDTATHVGKSVALAIKTKR
jgi:hypothetical protein